MIAPHHAPLTVFGQCYMRTLGALIGRPHVDLTDCAYLLPIADRIASHCATETRRADLGNARESHIRDCERIGIAARLIRSDLTPAAVVMFLDPADFAEPAPQAQARPRRSINAGQSPLDLD